MGSRRTVFYTAGANSADPTCGNTTQAKAWVGLVCRVMAGAPAPSGPDIPDGKSTGYDMYGNVTTLVETSGTATRTTTTRYDTAGREVFEKTTSTILGSTAVPGTFTKYDRVTGLVSYTGEANTGGTDATTNRVSSTYDQWGRAVMYTNAAGETGTTTFDSAGRVASFTDPKGSSTFTYDGVDAVGKVERRGLVTKVVVSRSGSGGALTFTGAYDTTGGLLVQDLPGGITATSERNILGQETGLTYAGQVTPVEAVTDPVTGETTWAPGAPARAAWVAWTVERDGLGRVAREYTSTGAAFNPDPAVTTPEPGDTGTQEVGAAQPYDRAYTYDGAGRLVRVADRTALTNGPDGLGPDVPASAGAPCQVRSYGFDGTPGLNGARTSTTVATHADGDCSGTTGVTTSTATHSYDGADRLTTGMRVNGGNPVGSYVYDAFGRQTSMPASDAPNRSGGNLVLGYFDDGLPRTVSQGDTSTVFTLDSQSRRVTQTSTDATSVTGTVIRHYTDGSDNPSWVEETIPGQPTVTTRFVEGLSSELGAMIRGDGEATINLATPRGDNITAVTIPPTQPGSTNATAIAGWVDVTEYGQPVITDSAPDPATKTAVTGPVGYGFLGGHQRATTEQTANLTLMGVRYYNRATGAFTSPDPVHGGNDTSYGYPGDPVNDTDIDGKWRRRAWNWIKRNKGNIALAAATFIPGVGAGVWAFRGYRLYRAVSAGKQGLSATRGVSRMAGRFWTGRAKKGSSSWGGTIYNGKRGTYRTTTRKDNYRFKGNYSNFNRGKKNVHVRINPSRLDRVWRQLGW